MSKRIITIGFIVMLIINLILITMMVLHTNSDDKWKGPSSGMLVKQLEFNEEQEVMFGQLREDHFAVVEPKMKRIRELKKALMNTSDKKEAKKLTSDIGSLEGEIDYLTFEHFMKVRNMCTAKQKVKMDELKKRISKHMSERHHHNRERRSKH